LIPILVIAAFVIMHVQSDMSGQATTPVAPPAAPSPLSLIVPALMLLLWGVGQLRCMISRRAMERGRGFRPFIAAERTLGLLRLAALAIFAIGVFWLGWLDSVRAIGGDLIVVDELLCVLPFLLLLLGLWWSFHPLDALVREATLIRTLDQGRPLRAPPTRSQFVLGALRHQLLLALVPATLATAWGESSPWLVQRLITALSLGPELRQLAEPIAALSGLLLILIISPAILRALWDVVRIDGGELADLSHATCRRHNVRVVGPLLWRTNGAVLNAAILGLFWPVRYLLLTDALVEHLSRRQLEGVLAHEVAHVKRAHMAWMAMAVLAVVSLAGWVYSLAIWLTIPIDEPVPERVTLLAAAASLAAALLALGHVSRRFEWQADAFAVRHLSLSEGPDTTAATEGAARAMSEALSIVAASNGMSERTWGFRHGSIADRRRRAEALIGIPLNAFAIDRTVRATKWIIIIMLAASVCMTVLPIAMGW
jgi:Zn-dependent protease with chaperone function